MKTLDPVVAEDLLVRDLMRHFQRPDLHSDSTRYAAQKRTAAMLSFIADNKAELLAYLEGVR